MLNHIIILESIFNDMAAFYPIDYIKSVQKQRLIYKLNARIIFSYMICYLSAFAGFIMISAAFGELFIEPGAIFYTPALVLFLLIILHLWTIMNLISLNRMVKFDGKNRTTNKDDIIAILKQFYKLDNLDTTDENVIRNIKPYRFILNGKIITCLFDHEIVYLNLTSLQNYNLISSFSGLYNYYKCKRIAQRFKQLQANSY